MANLKLWLISQTANDDYDTYDSAVVVAPDEEAARRIHPAGYENTPDHHRHFSVWALAEKVEVKWIGYASDDLTNGEVVCASFNAG